MIRSLQSTIVIYIVKFQVCATFVHALLPLGDQQYIGCLYSGQMLRYACEVYFNQIYTYELTLRAIPSFQSVILVVIAQF